MHETPAVNTIAAEEAPIFMRRNRLFAVCAVWVFFAIASTIIYANFVHDVGATYWAMWSIVLPVALPFIWLLDVLISQHKQLSLHPELITAIDCAFAISLWFTPWLSIGCLLMVSIAYAIKRIA